MGTDSHPSFGGGGCWTGVGVGVMVALRTLAYLNSDTELQGLCGVARSVACKEKQIRGEGSRFVYLHF